jgi:hypothetical protein
MFLLFIYFLYLICVVEEGLHKQYTLAMLLCYAASVFSRVRALDFIPANEME